MSFLGKKKGTKMSADKSNPTTSDIMGTVEFEAVKDRWDHHLRAIAEWENVEMETQYVRKIRIDLGLAINRRIHAEYGEDIAVGIALLRNQPMQIGRAYPFHGGNLTDDKEIDSLAVRYTLAFLREHFRTKRWWRFTKPLRSDREYRRIFAEVTEKWPLPHSRTV